MTKDRKLKLLVRSVICMIPAMFVFVGIKLLWWGLGNDPASYSLLGFIAGMVGICSLVACVAGSIVLLMYVVRNFPKLWAWTFERD